MLTPFLSHFSAYFAFLGVYLHSEEKFMYIFVVKQEIYAAFAKIQKYFGLFSLIFLVLQHLAIDFLAHVFYNIYGEIQPFLS